ncbi:hypothetical protein KPH14_003225 [Odynerus spinipes]|uniref:Uncharacterized protein n=1 Tax=Odynerus spinipes TaxID=1348599 RepID=A0AAD9R8T8_9HYME|nr:hypothetical protein KPH14_003225 [Odynerus spinipes]
MKPTSIAIFLLFVYTVAALRCVIKEKKSQEDPEIHVIHLDDGSKDSSDPEIVSFQIPDKRKREIWDSTAKVFCKSDEDCGPGEKCIAYLRCVKATKRTSEKKEIEEKPK